MKSKSTICIVFLALLVTPHFTEAGLFDGIGNLVGGKFQQQFEFAFSFVWYIAPMKLNESIFTEFAHIKLIEFIFLN